jgi:hypothetical protein
MTASRWGVAAAAALALPLLAASGSGGEREEWAGLAQRVSAQEAGCTPEAARAQALVRFAVDSARARTAGLGRRDASELAQAVAAHEVLSTLYPGRVVFFDARLLRLANASTAGSVEGAALDAGYSAAADALLFGWPAAVDGRDRARPRSVPALYCPLPAKPAVCPLALPAAATRPWWKESPAVEL